MSEQKHAKIGNDIKEALEAVGSWVFNVHGSEYQRRGVPDFYIAHRQWTGWLELKVDKDDLSPIQRVNMRKLKDRNVKAVVFHVDSATMDVTLEDENGEVLTRWDGSWADLLPNPCGLRLLRMLKESTV